MLIDNLPDGWSVAGWEDGNNWVNTEDGGRMPSDSDLEDSQMTTLSFASDSETTYYTIHGGFDEDYTVEDAIEDLKEQYGID